MLERGLARNRIGRIGRIPIGIGTDTIRLQRVRLITHSCRFVLNPANEKNLRRPWLRLKSYRSYRAVSYRCLVADTRCTTVSMV
jgi:hypothetical protein